MAVMDLQAFARVVAGFFTHHDVLLTPTLAQSPLKLGELVSTTTTHGGPLALAPASSRSPASSVVAPLADHRLRARHGGARVEDRTRTGKDTGFGRFPSRLLPR
jgi:hypothetical protein